MYLTQNRHNYNVYLADIVRNINVKLVIYIKNQILYKYLDFVMVYAGAFAKQAYLELSEQLIMSQFVI